MSSRDDDRSWGDAVRRHADDTWYGPYTSVVVLGLVLGLLQGVPVGRRPFVVQVAPLAQGRPSDLLHVTLPLAYVLVVGATLGFVARDRASAVAVGAGIGVADLVVALARAFSGRMYHGQADVLLMDAVRAVLLGLAVAGIALAAQRCGRAWGAPALVGPRRDDALADGGGDPTATGAVVRPATVQVALFGVATAAGLLGVVLSALGWPYASTGFPSMGRLGLMLLAGVAGTVGGLGVPRPTHRGTAWVSGGALAGYTLFAAVHDGIDAIAEGASVFGVALLAAVVLVAAAVHRAGTSSWERAARVAAAGTVLVAALDLAAGVQFTQRPVSLEAILENTLTNYAAVAVVAAAAYGVAGTLARGARADDGEATGPSRHTGLATGMALVGSLPLVVVLVPLVSGVLIILSIGGGIRVEYITDLVLTRRHLQLLAVGVGAAAGVVAPDEATELTVGLAVAFVAGTLVPTVLWAAIFGVQGGPTSVLLFMAYNATLGAAALALAVAVGRRYAAVTG